MLLNDNEIERLDLIKAGITDEMWDGVKAIRVQYLNISYNSLSRPNVANNWSGASFRGLYLIGVPAGFAIASKVKPDQLHALSITMECTPESMAMLARFGSLAELLIESVAYETGSAAKMRGLGRLKKIRISGPIGANEILNEAIANSAVTTIEASFAGLCRDTIMAAARCNRLREIAFTTCSFAAKDIQEITSNEFLSSLSLAGCEVGDDTVLALAKMKSLRHLNLSATNVSSIGVNEILRTRRVSKLVMAPSKRITLGELRDIQLSVIGKGVIQIIEN